MVLLNPGCNYTTGRSRWNKVATGLRGRIGEFDVEELRSEGAVKEQVRAAFVRGVRNFAAAGGDGTVNLVANALLELGEKGIALGAVGLGSSNDFHKPFRKEDYIAGMPVRIEFARARSVDVIRIEYESSGGAGRDPSQNGDSPHFARYCLLNASIGITAEGNAFFNTRTTLIRTLQRVSQDLAVTGAALRSLFMFKDIPARLVIDGEPALDLPITNLGIIKRPNFAGSLRYDTEISLDDGRLGVNVTYGLSLFGRVAALTALSRGRFQGRPNTLCRHGTDVRVTSEQEFAVELDGEIVRTSSARFSVIPK
ncbi:MAG TPA: diacylglycerol kinase family protein, partial [bacterium]|nr:diacylglycerol kinase family protein [bacterium]